MKFVLGVRKPMLALTLRELEPMRLLVAGRSAA
jgi:hypothetical protein